MITEVHLHKIYHGGEGMPTTGLPAAPDFFQCLCTFAQQLLFYLFKCWASPYKGRVKEPLYPAVAESHTRSRHTLTSVATLVPMCFTYHQLFPTTRHINSKHLIYYEVWHTMNCINDGWGTGWGYAPERKVPGTPCKRDQRIRWIFFLFCLTA